jgi:pheromone shutdown protein TraB
MRKITIGTSKIFIPDVIIGLVSEADKVKGAYHKVKPDLVVIQTSEEQMKGLKKVVEGEEFDYFLSNYEEIYARKLAEFGEVKLPPPCYETAMNLCLENETPIEAIDMDDMLFADVYCENITGWDLYRHSFRIGRMKRKQFKAKSPEDFALKWDKEINKLKGFRNLEAKREEYMAREILRLAKEYERILCVLDIQRAEGVSKRVNEKKDTHSEDTSEK